MSQGFSRHRSDDFSLSRAGVVHVQGPDHGVRGVSLRELRLWQCPEEAEGVWVGKDCALKFPLHFFLRDSVCLSWCTGLNRPIKAVSWDWGVVRKLPLAMVLWSPESLAFNFAAIQPQQIHVWPDLLALTFIQSDFQSGTAVRFGARLPSL